MAWIVLTVLMLGMAALLMYGGVNYHQIENDLRKYGPFRKGFW